MGNCGTGQAQAGSYYDGMAAKAPLPKHNGVRIIEQEARNLQAHIDALGRNMRDLEFAAAAREGTFQLQTAIVNGQHGTIEKMQKQADELRSRDTMHQAVIERMRLEIERMRQEPRFDAAMYERADAWLAVCEALPERMKQPGTGRQGVLAAIRELQRKARLYDAMIRAAGSTL